MKPTLVVMAAGFGSRYGGIKQIDPVGTHGETLLDFSTYDAFQSGFGKVVYIIRPDIEKDFCEKIFDRVSKNVNAEYVFQTHESLLTDEQINLSKERTKPWGTSHCVLCAEKAINNTPFAVINADDYYGREAFQILGKHLSEISIDSTDHAMVGYLLKNTMTPVGSVSRGVCEVDKSGYLDGMRENLKIEYDSNGIVSHLPEGDARLTGEEWVSMNFFGFTPKAFDYLKQYWNNFIKQNVSQLKTECLLPDFAGELVKKGLGTMKVYSTSEKWFGMTYKEDRDTVRNNLALKTKQGFYPEILWEKQ